MATEIRVPTLGESVSEATVGTWFKKVGDAVKVDEPLLELETDKVTIEVPAPVSGTLSEIVAQAGETVGLGALLGQIAEGAAAAAPAATGCSACDGPSLPLLPPRCRCGCTCDPPCRRRRPLRSCWRKTTSRPIRSKAPASAARC